MKKMIQEEENFGSLVMECTNCRLKFHAPELKLSPMTNEMVCRNCYNFPGSRVSILKDKAPEIKKNPFFKPKEEKSAYLTLPPHLLPKKESGVEKEATVKNLPAGQVAYLCEDCRYTFTRSVGKFNGSCPYCSRKRIKVLRRR